MGESPLSSAKAISSSSSLGGGCFSGLWRQCRGWCRWGSRAGAGKRGEGGVRESGGGLSVECPKVTEKPNPKPGDWPGPSATQVYYSPTSLFQRLEDSSRNKPGPEGLSGGVWNGDRYIIKEGCLHYIYGSDGQLISYVMQLVGGGLEPQNKINEAPNPDEKPKPLPGDWPEPDPPPEDP